MESNPAATDLDDELISRSLAVAAELRDLADVLTSRRERRRRSRLARLLASEEGTRLIFFLADRVLRPVSDRAAARQLASLATGRLIGLSPLDRTLLRLAGIAGSVFPWPVVDLVASRLRRQTASLIYPAAPPGLLGRRLRTLWSIGRRPNVNLLGEAVLGWDEARRRGAALERLLRHPDLDCVSVKVSSIATGLSLVDFSGSVDRVADPLLGLYRAATACDPPKLVNLDMEEHRDLDLTVEVFTRLLDRPELRSMVGGIALQAYLPDSHRALERLVGWAHDRCLSGGAPIRNRLVKGANLALERVEGELRSWPPAPYPTKAETDASYKRLLERLIHASASTGAVLVGVATHNLFDVAFAIVLAEQAGVKVDIEMLAGMADAQAAAVAGRTGQMLLYVPVTSRRDFRRNALAYLARRLDENATPEGFLRHSLEMSRGSADWEEQAARFGAAVRDRHTVGTAPRHSQDRRARAVVEQLVPISDPWRNEPDTDLTVASNRMWAVDALGPRVDKAPPSAASDEVERAITRSIGALPTWSATSTQQRRDLLHAVAERMAADRGEALAVMAAEAGKTFAEGDPEVSEAIDYARWYGRSTLLLDQLEGVVHSEPLGVVVVAPPWNFPYAIPAGGVFAALAAGNSVIVKPSPQAPSTTSLLATQLWAAGVPGDVLQVVAAPDGPAGRLLVTHRGVAGVILTGSIQTALLFRRWAPERRLLAETSGKNAIVVAATADVDQAVSDVVRSAFSHAGQKCSAASLAIVDASIYDHSPFLRQLRDATASLRVGPASDPATEVGPIVGPFTGQLERALTRLDPGEDWLVAPRLLDPATHLWSPGVRTGVRPGSWAHMNEWFGPVLAVMRSRGLGSSIAAQNAVAFGLTAGLQSLDPSDWTRWADAVEAGNLYINRPTTGALVGRQPFGGWKASSVGPTTKTGGPNSLIGLRRWRDPAPVNVEKTRHNYERWWAEYFSLPSDEAGLEAEANVLRYRPFAPGVLLRVTENVADDEIVKAAVASRVTGTPLSVSMASPRRGLSAAADLAEIPVVVESAGSFAVSIGGYTGTRLRVLGSPETEVLEAAAHHGLTVFDEPICSHGRVELLRWLREQSVSRSLHRYGNIVYDR